jgi:hypothetical protein
MLGETEDARDARIRSIARTLAEIFRRADSDAVSTAEAAEAMVRERLEAA